MRILHTSDLHGRYKGLLGIDAPFDVWIDTGDFFPNRGRVARTGHTISLPAEHSYQRKWLGYKDLLHRLEVWLDGRPMLSVPGNHDFLDLGARLAAQGAAAQTVGTAAVEVGGLRFAGFREIPVIAHEWPGECDDFGALVEATFASKPDVLLTHAPAAGVLDGSRHDGIPELTAALDGGGQRSRFMLRPADRRPLEH